MINLAETLKKLIAFKTVSSTNEPDASFGKTVIKEAIGWVKNEISGLPLFVKELESHGQPVLLLTTKKTDSPEILLYAHIDVVPAESAEMFIAKEGDGKIWGRGAYDMKFAIACYIELLKELGDNLSQYDFGILITADEEIGGESVDDLLKEKKIGAKVCVIPDGGYDCEFVDTVKGIMQVNFISHGVSTHASTPWKGRNPINSLMSFLLELESKLSGSSNNDKHDHNTVVISKFNAGNATNRAPAEASASIDIRFVPGTTKDSLKNIIEETIKNLHEAAIDYQISFFDDSFVIDQKNEYITRFKETTCQVLRVNHISGHISNETSDATYFVKHNIPAIVTRPIGGGLHADDENVDLKSLEMFYETLKKFIIESQLENK